MRFLAFLLFVLELAPLAQAESPLPPSDSAQGVEYLPSVNPPATSPAEDQGAEDPDAADQAVAEALLLEGKSASWLPMSECDLWGLSCWEGNFEFGMNGSSGNSDTFNLRFGFGATRKTDASETTLDLDYKKDSQNNMETANRLFFEGRKEWFLGDSPWSIYVHGTFEYDEFRAFDSRAAVDSGLGYLFFKNDATEFGGRFGSGVSREIGGPDDRFVPEASLGLDFERQLTKRQKIVATADYFPDWSDFMDYRLNTKLYWSVILDEVNNLTLKVGVDNRYDSTPHGAKHNDLNYSTVLLWDF